MLKELTETTVDLELEATCESPHRTTTCSVTAEWSRPPSLCGCFPRQQVCNNIYRHVFSGTGGIMFCERCKFKTTVDEWQKGWYKV